MSKPRVAQKQISHRTLVRRAVLILVMFLLAGAVSYPAAADWTVDRVNQFAGTKFPHVYFPIVLGLDLQGGTRLEYQADLSKIKSTEQTDAMNGVRDVIERRVNSLGVSEPLVQVSKAGNDWRLSIELAGIRDVNEAIKLIGETPILDFRESNANPQKDLTDEQRKQVDTKNADILKKVEASLADIRSGKMMLEEVVRKESDDATTKDKGGDLGWILDQSGYRGLNDRVHDLKIGDVSGVLDDGGNLYIAQVLERKSAGVEIQASHILIQFSGATESASTSTKAQAKVLAEKILKEVMPANFVAKAKAHSEEPGANTTGGDLGWFKKGDMVPEFENAAFALKTGEVSGVIETPFGFHIIMKTGEKPLEDQHVRAVVYRKMQASDLINTEPWKRTELTGKNLKRAQLEFDQRTGASQVALQFDDAGKKMFADITKRNVGKPVAIFLDNQPISIPTVQQEITGGQAVINGSFTVAEAKQLAQRLQAGALPVPINIIAQQSVGPTLGSESVAASIRAGLFGFLFVALFMIFLYRLPGLLSVVALTFYAAILITLFKIIPVTLTLSGIAGFILSLGIAVDANVLIYERLKEELKSGKIMSIALDEAFRRAWTSIRDGNATTLIACAVLYGYSSSIIKGFALTLALGVLISMFTAIIVVRTLLKLVAQPSFVRRAPWLFLDKKEYHEEK
jgi:protein-export membrane protein SecD